MGHVINQFDIPDRQLLTANPRQRAGNKSDIGEAKITRTIFGGVRVNVLHERDKKRRTWLRSVFVLAAVAAIVWQGWALLNRKHAIVPPPVPLSESIVVGAPVFIPAHILPDTHTLQRKPESLIQSEINSMLSGPLPKRPPGSKSVAKSDALRPPSPNNPQITQKAGINKTAMVSGKPASSARPGEAAPQPAENPSVGVVPLAEPLDKGDTSSTTQTGSSEPPDPTKSQD